MDLRAENARKGSHGLSRYERGVCALLAFRYSTINVRLIKLNFTAKLACRGMSLNLPTWVKITNGGSKPGLSQIYSSLV